MAKLTKAGVLEIIDEWEKTQRKITGAEEAKNRELAPLVERHNEELKPVLAKHEKKIAGLVDKAAELEAEVVEYLTQQNKDQIIAAGGAVAEQKTETKIGSRVIDPQKFIAKAKSKGAAMWECVTVGVAKAIKLIGEEEIDKIADKKETTTIVRQIRLK